MDGQFDFTTLLWLVIAIAAILKLRKGLGRHTDRDNS
jgi:hypothetical protein